MAVAFRLQSFSFSDSSGPQSHILTFAFPSAVKEATAAIAGFRFDYSQDPSNIIDQKVDVVDVSVRVTARTGPTVQVRVQAHFADTGRDDPYNGRIDVLAIAEL